MFVLLFFPLLSALLWRLGGGAFTTLTGLNFGTDSARVLRSTIALIFPIFFGWYALLALPALFAGICLAGWGAFQGMGTETGIVLESSWKRALPNAFGLRAGTFWHDFVGMLLCGALCVLPLTIVLGGLAMTGRNTFPSAMIVWLAGFGFAPCYALARLVPWGIPKFAGRQEWGEVLTGAMLGAFFVWSVSC
jgi:hypothetical protein